MDLDHTNLRILSLLEKDARLPTAEIARQVHLSRPAVQERIARMEGAGVITGYRVQIGPAGGVRAMVFVRIAERPCDPALQFLAAQTGVVEVVSLSGELDAVVRVNLIGILLCTKVAMDIMQAQDGVTSHIFQTVGSGVK
ncbi:MAG: Lrp/AsnC family transcriptional regulator, partial [Pseudomonadota bacterium]|nr:Lrp/AsnC family transcriptional regulator [Pseudomonadota bacterium]